MQRVKYLAVTWRLSRKRIWSSTFV